MVLLDKFPQIKKVCHLETSLYHFFSTHISCFFLNASSVEEVVEQVLLSFFCPFRGVNFFKWTIMTFMKLVIYKALLLQLFDSL